MQKVETIYGRPHPIKIIKCYFKCLTVDFQLILDFSDICLQLDSLWFFTIFIQFLQRFWYLGVIPFISSQISSPSLLGSWLLLPIEWIPDCQKHEFDDVVFDSILLWLHVLRTTFIGFWVLCEFRKICQGLLSLVLIADDFHWMPSNIE